LITFETTSPFSDEQLQINENYSASLGLPALSDYRASGPLAVIGGGHSLNQYRYTLQSWSGDKWAINRTWKWCQSNNVTSDFFSFDANPSVADMVDGAEKAFLYYRTNPAVYKKLAGKDIYIGNSNEGGSTSAGAALIAGLRAGYASVTLFGCESCFQQNASHVYGHWEPTDYLVIWCGGLHFFTNPQMLIGAIELATMITSSSGLVKEHSGGLLRALCENNCEYEIVGYSEGFLDKMVAA
jgi:hypothetical protein